MTRDQIITELTQEYAKRRDDNIAEHQRRTDEACERCAGLREALNARRAALISGVKRTLLSDKKDEGAVASLPSDMEQYNARICALLKKGGLPEDFLAPVYDCAVCKDDGFLYEPERRMCACFEKALAKRMMDTLVGVQRGQTFEYFDISLFDDEEIDGISQKKMITAIRKRCEAFANEYPDMKTATKNQLLCGTSGLGKTYMMNCIINRVAQRGYLPVYVSAYQLLDTARRAYFGNNDSLMENYLSAGLLLIDDLGTEPLFDNITVVQLFNLISVRQNAGLSTVISTNFSLDEIKERYTERVASRFGDRSLWTRLDFIGEDVRERLRKNGAK